ncbi:uncharacterized protein LOC113290075 [Papaver somniferum]|uniref:uncharacterized protein LOC113290075 n=1 Tax=Papaver somniferum TaxID=3469 RepID=UPI000E6F9410|nr:uncharacterized protein LOC113290075 [Papaver somniferum]XP_026395385.1 uncharacterized protein LOC113290075 [Papaver somniferum]XP_026395386.1 uncharacterized protein LOC113290075 [Papaver somniferum]XP_026395387.1 uncharacterized protein LOC113290075 [Papaver somniferum]XP_026395388.1 uncharacterized protein LOC113290075 [Papaver somniferum]
MMYSFAIRTFRCSFKREKLMMAKEYLRKASFPRSPNSKGGSYDVNGKELRPSLGWTSEMGWTAPISKGTHALRAQLEAAKYDVIKYCTGTPYTRLCLYGLNTMIDV